MQLSPISLAITRLGGVRFSPAALFPSGTAGAWYDPSDASTLFSDTAGTTPSPTPGGGALSVVGLMLDKSQGLALGANVIVNSTFTTDTWWLKDAGVTISGGTANWAATAATFQIYNTGILTVGALYKVTFTITSISSGGLRAVAGSGTVGTTRTSPGTYTEYLLAAGSGTVAIQSVGASTTASVDDVSYQAVAGNHAIRYGGTTTAPELSARVNLLTYSEQFDNVVWTLNQINPFGSGSIANTTATLDPLGGNTADMINENNVSGVHLVSVVPTITGGLSYKISCSFKNAGRRYAYVNINTSGSGTDWITAIVDLNNGNVTSQSGTTGGSVTSATAVESPTGSGWYRLTLVGSIATTGGAFVVFGMSDVASIPNSLSRGWPSYTGNPANSVYYWGADLRPSNIGTSVPAYQRIADQYTYDSSGFPRYLKFDGIDDGMYTPANLNLSATDKATVFAGVRKQALTTGFVVETSAAAESNNGAFRVGVDSGGIEYFISSRGTVSQQVNIDNAAYLPPVSNVVQSSFDIAAPSVSVRLNGVAVGSNNSSQGTGNFGSYPLNVGARNVSGGTPTFLFNGYIYSLIVVGAASTAAQISSTESWINVKEGGVY